MQYAQDVGELHESVQRRGFLDLLAQRDRDDLAEMGTFRRYRAGERVMSQGDESDFVVVVLEGEVKVTLDTPDGREVVLNIYGHGDVVGEFEALGGYTTRTANVVALETIGCRVLTKQAFLDYLMAHPGASLALVRLMIRRLAAADRRRVDATTADASHTLATFLIELVRWDGAAGEDAPEVHFPLAQHDLASLLGVSRNSIVRALSRLRSRNLVVTSRGTIRIVNVPALRRYVESPPEG